MYGFVKRLRKVRSTPPTLKQRCVCIEQVHVIFHVTPGYLDIFPIYWFRPEFNAVFSDLIRRHASVVVGIYSGHAHTDSFRLIYKNGTKRSPSYAYASYDN